MGAVTASPTAILRAAFGVSLVLVAIGAGAIYWPLGCLAPGLLLWWSLPSASSPKSEPPR